MDDLELIATLGSAVPLRDPRARARSAERLSAHIGGHRQRSRRRAVLFATAAAACIGVAVVVAVRVTGGRENPPATTTTFTPIPGRIPVDGIWYQRVDETFNGITDDYSYTTTSTREIWVRPDGSGRTVDVPRGMHFLTEADRAAWVRRGRPDRFARTRSEQLVAPGGVPDTAAILTYSFGHTPLSYEQMLGLPDDPIQLAARIGAEARACDCGITVEQEQFDIVHDLLRAPAVPAKLRLALMGAARRLPDIDPVRTATDALGRRGITVSRISQNGPRLTRFTMILDPATGTLLGDREVTARTGAIRQGGPVVPANTVLGDATYITEGLVTSLTDDTP